MTDSLLKRTTNCLPGPAAAREKPAPTHGAIRHDAARQGTASAVPSIPTTRFGALAPEGIALKAKTNAKRIAILVLFVAFASAPLVTAQVGYSLRAKEIGMHLKCMCRGCDMSAGGCAHPGGSFSGPCDTAKAMLQEVDQHLAKGESEQQIIDAFVAKYGSIVYMEPPKKGFGLVAWLMPIVYSLVGLTLLVLVVRKMRSRQIAAAPPAPTVHSDVLDRARAQAARETED